MRNRAKTRVPAMSGGLPNTIPFGKQVGRATPCLRVINRPAPAGLWHGERHGPTIDPLCYRHGRVFATKPHRDIPSRLASLLGSSEAASQLEALPHGTCSDLDRGSYARSMVRLELHGARAAVETLRVSIGRRILVLSGSS